nr:sigma-70 family RNA polymerase sigma factor [uncultured Holophaga sp.]
MDVSHEPSLIAQTLQGDGDAFGTLVEPYLGLFYAGIHRILQDPQDAQDALQEALLSIHTELHRFQGMSKFSTWAYRICINEALMMRRSKLRKREDKIEDFLPRFSPDGHLMSTDSLRDWSQEAIALDLVEQEQVRAKIREGLEQLSDEQRSVFILRDLEGMDTEEVAQMLGISRGLVRQRLHRARLGLRGVLDAFMTGGRS